MQKWLVNHCMCTYIHLSSKRLLLAVYVGHRGKSCCHNVALVSAWFCLGQVSMVCFYWVIIKSYFRIITALLRFSPATESHCYTFIRYLALKVKAEVYLHCQCCFFFIPSSFPFSNQTCLSQADWLINSVCVSQQIYSRMLQKWRAPERARAYAQKHTHATSSHAGQRALGLHRLLQPDFLILLLLLWSEIFRQEQPLPAGSGQVEGQGCAGWA